MKLNWHSDIGELFSTKNTKTAQKLKQADIHTIYDLLWIFPRCLKKITPIEKLSSLSEGALISAQVKVVGMNSSPGKLSKKKLPLSNITLIVQDLTSKKTIDLKWFNAWPNLAKRLRDADHLNILGAISFFNGKPQIINPHTSKNLINKSLHVEYPTFNTLPGEKIKQLQNKIPNELWEKIPSVVNDESHLMPINIAFKRLHGKTSDFTEGEEAVNRIIYEEFYIEQTRIAQRKKEAIDSNEDNSLKLKKNSFQSFLEKIPFELTKDQRNAIDEIISDIKAKYKMSRILQGDVGCGKTIVAFASAFIATSSNYQVAIMCPTEALAKQHFKNSKSYFNKNEIGLLTSSISKKERHKILEKISKGSIKLIIGTHSLIQEEVSFMNLGFTIIDEQHKFGVKQRISLAKKSRYKNSLLMSATPIPRSLSLTHFGDLRMSVIKELPSGRKKISSRIINDRKFDLFLNFIQTRLKMNEQAYIVVPAIEESEVMEIQNLARVEKFFKKTFPIAKIGTLHGKMQVLEKDQIIQDFESNNIELLISTSVVEVGIDNPNATVMVVFGPERFGLSSLHQLRGRVGRGGKPGFFFMVEDKKLSRASVERLRVIENCSDGFVIAEEDLKLRGEGNLIGIQQSGSNVRKIASLIEHKNILDQVIRDFKNFENKNNLPSHIIKKDEVNFTI